MIPILRLLSYLLALTLVSCGVVGSNDGDGGDACDLAEEAYQEARRSIDNSCVVDSDCLWAGYARCGCPRPLNTGNDLDRLSELQQDFVSKCPLAGCSNNITCEYDTVGYAHPPVCDGGQCVAPETVFITSADIVPTEIASAETELEDSFFIVTVTMTGDYGRIVAGQSRVYVQSGGETVSTTPQDGTTVMETADGARFEIPYSWLRNQEPGDYSVEVRVATEYESFTKRVGMVRINP